MHPSIHVCPFGPPCSVLGNEATLSHLNMVCMDNPFAEGTSYSAVALVAYLCILPEQSPWVELAKAASGQGNRSAEAALAAVDRILPCPCRTK